MRMEKEKDYSVLSEKFNEVSDHVVLAVLYRTFMMLSQNHYYLQCALLPISDEPDILLENESVFWNKAMIDGKACYTVTGDNLLQFLGLWDGYVSDSEEDVKRQEEIVVEAMKDKMLLFTPFYKYDEKKNIFYKNVDANEDVRTLPLQHANESFFVVPILNEQNFRLFLAHKTFSLSNWNMSLFGKPKYILYGCHLVMAPLTMSANSDYNCQWEKSDEGYLDLLFDSDDFVRSGFLHDENTIGYCFLEKASLPLMRKVQALPYQNDESQDEMEEITYPTEQQYDTRKALLGFESYLKSKNLYYFDDDVKNFHACLKCRLLTILAGMSGTGKTRLPLEYANYFNMTEEDNTLLFVPISPSYTEPSDMLGFYNPANESYMSSETGLVSFLKHAAENPEKMHMVIFDEMNLAQIEYYFAPFLSILEREKDRRILRLYDKNLECRNKDLYPDSIKIGDNVLFVGTINLDDTTKELSERLLDRSFVISLRRASFDKYNGVMLDKVEEENSKTYQGELTSLMPRMAKTFNFNSFLTPTMREFFDEFNKILSEKDPQKGISFRTVRNIALYLANSNIEEEATMDDITTKQAFDYVFRQTVLRRIRGSEEILSEVLGCKMEDGSIHSPIYDLLEKYSEISSFELSKQEIVNKILELKRYGYVR